MNLNLPIDARPIVKDAPNFYWSANDNILLLYRMPGYGDDDWVEVIGDPDGGGYEWVIRKGGKIVQHSDCGYGSTFIAMHDGMAAYESLPDSGMVREMSKTLRLFAQADDYTGTSKRHAEKIASQNGECDDGDGWLQSAFEQMHALVKKLNAKDLW